MPCSPAGSGHYNCQWYTLGDGRTGGTPVLSSNGGWWAWTEAAPNNTTGWPHQEPPSSAVARSTDQDKSPPAIDIEQPVFLPKPRALQGGMHG
ncbi:hypothetical protein JRI60_34600 [Archangium violaceum]|uniref:hypothetical protein n=1 Tax=Archangium violaceum TaxID=83451 RepID=UPI001951FB8C|nr:hypothetical protein [Archangium violaceum]QRN94244.1 hypothetical protein JRI60_34600 [Archangium violaceum]